MAKILKGNTYDLIIPLVLQEFKQMRIQNAVEILKVVKS